MTTLNQGTREYLEKLIFASVDLIAQPISFSFDRGVTWSTGSWQSIGSVKHTTEVDGVDVVRYSRVGQILLGDSVLLPGPGEHPIWIQVTDVTEIPIISAGSLVIAADD